ncbi:MAG TPA: hypothetical protein VGL56_12020 [Fimbriimonadaceae bacterium]|jgi:hypothetical protein
MANNRIYLGVDIHSNLAVSLEVDSNDTYTLAVSESGNGNEMCRFQCSGEELSGITENKPLELETGDCQCSVHCPGDEIIFEFRDEVGQEISTYSLSANSFVRVMRLAHNRAFAI